MLRKLLATAIVLTIVDGILGAPVEGVHPNGAKVKTSHITRGDLDILKEKLEDLEADLELLEPEIPADDANVDEDVQPQIADNGDEDDELPKVPKPEVIKTPSEAVAPEKTQQSESAQKPQSAPKDDVERPAGDETVPIHENVAPTKQDQDLGEKVEEGGNAEVNGEEEEEVPDETNEEEEEEEEEEEAGEEEEMESDFVPYRPENDDLYLEELIIQALTILYRKDAERVEKILTEEYLRLADSEDDFPQNVAPAPQDLSKQDSQLPAEEGVFQDRPFTDDELIRKDALDLAEDKLIADMEDFEDQGLTLEELIADLQDKKQNGEHRPGKTPTEGEALANKKSTEEDNLFGAYKDDLEEAVQGETKPHANVPAPQPRRPAIPHTAISKDVSKAEADNARENEDAEELLNELVEDLNSSVKKPDAKPHSTGHM
ncbi:uncharacterized protein [Diadema antillarum]|uniref:uncharacterized protein isoform X2 n=1 Tax=Diadema antillarum TaxID=105358 RepID=UPI003A89B35E